jgi:peptidoglycan/xylan/chitin deacetylase (PgdA/CDA1 family)
MSKRLLSRRGFLGRTVLGAAGTLAARGAWASPEPEVRHVVTLSFDDGFRKSSLKTVEIYERFGLSACINVVATAHLPTFEMPNEYHEHPVGDFAFWNELQARGHEIMPHGLRHANKTQMPLAEAQDLILRCLDIFDRELEGFDRKGAVFNFPFNASTPEIEEWLSTQVRAFRTAGPAINPLPRAGQVRLTCTSHGPDPIDEDLDRRVDELLAQPSGWLIYNTHGLDDEGWGPLSSAGLERLLARLVEIPTLRVLPAGRALAEAQGVNADA